MYSFFCQNIWILLVTQPLYSRNTDLGVIHPGRLLLNGLGPVGVVYLGQAVVAPVRPVQTNVVLHARVVHSLHNNWRYMSYTSCTLRYMAYTACTTTDVSCNTQPAQQLTFHVVHSLHNITLPGTCCTHPAHYVTWWKQPLQQLTLHVVHSLHNNWRYMSYTACTTSNVITIFLLFCVIT